MEDLDGFIIEHVTTRIIVLKKCDPNKLYRAAELCVDFWKAFDGHHTVIGKRIKSLSANNRLPIEPAGRTSCNKQQYRLI